ncbi:MAG: cellulase family glycosylhydrolase, partial [Anaerolineae bacterium]|nr:cellulase family glycosylhydrolase [Anaerolineae bacterium]
VAVEDLPLKSYIPLVGWNMNAPPTIFGVQTYGSTRPGATYTPYLIETGASWARVMVNWADAEPANTDPAGFNWSAIDAALAIALRSSPRLIVTIDRAPAWAAERPRGPIYPSMLPEFAQFVQALVERYDGDGLDDAPGHPVVRHWEIYNEPDASSTLFVAGWGEYGAEYAQMLSYVYPAVKQANNQAQVIFGGIAYDWWADTGGPFVETFLDDALAAGAGAHFDIMNFHFYPGFWRRWTDDASSGLSEKAQAIRSKLDNHQVNKPVIITEAGWHSSNEPLSPSSPEEQARYVVELFVESMAADIDLMIWWMLFDPGSGIYDNGLITSASPPTIKPAFIAYKELVARLRYAEFVRQLETPAPVFDPEDGTVQSMDAYELRDPVNRRTIYVAWMNPVNGTTAWQLRLPAAQATRYNIYNTESIPLNDAADGVADGFITVMVGSHPVFVEVSW